MCDWSIICCSLSAPSYSKRVSISFSLSELLTSLKMRFTFYSKADFVPREASEKLWQTATNFFEAAYSISCCILKSAE